jgi:hypothetical protein
MGREAIPHISEQIIEALLTLKRPSHQIIFAGSRMQFNRPRSGLRRFYDETSNDKTYNDRTYNDKTHSDRKYNHKRYNVKKSKETKRIMRHIVYRQNILIIHKLSNCSTFDYRSDCLSFRSRKMLRETPCIRFFPIYIFLTFPVKVFSTYNILLHCNMSLDPYV